MSINSVFGSAATSDIGQLVQRLVTAADKDKDGTLSSSAFWRPRSSPMICHCMMDGAC